MATFAVTLIALFCVRDHGVSSSCSRTEKVTYIRDNLEPECQSAVMSILLEENPELNEVNFDLACTSRCMGKYENWLVRQCNGTNGETLAHIACLKSTIKITNEVSRCRHFFPDVANDIVFASTSQCGALFSSSRIICTSSCREPLNTLIDTLGCCYQSIYNNSGVITSLSEQQFLTSNQASVLTQFRMSELLETCRNEAVPNACNGDPFTMDNSREMTGTNSVTTDSMLETISSAHCLHLCGAFVIIARLFLAVSVI